MVYPDGVLRLGRSAALLTSLGLLTEINADNSNKLEARQKHSVDMNKSEPHASRRFLPIV